MYNMQNLFQDFTQEGANTSWQFKFQEGQFQEVGGGGIKAPPEVNPMLSRAIEFTSGDIPKVYHYVPTSKKTTLRQTYGC